MLKADNHIGYEVQGLHETKGWISISDPYETREEAFMVLCRMPANPIEKRVYEAIECSTR